MRHAVAAIGSFVTLPLGQSGGFLFGAGLYGGLAPPGLMIPPLESYTALCEQFRPTPLTSLGMSGRVLTTAKAWNPKQ